MKFTDADATNRQSNLLKRNFGRSISLGRLDFSDSFFHDNSQSRNNSIDAETFSVNMTILLSPMYRADGYISEQSRLERCFPRVCVGTGRPANIAISLGMCPPGSDTTGRTAHLRNSREARAPGGWTHRRNRTDSKNPRRASPGHRTNRAAHLDSSQSSDASPGRLGGASQWDPKTLPLLPPN
jgi:hypothetical protein